ncbi:MAG: HAMP domain-containing histidine kinase [Haliscomenobacter sp.]|nr:HAMP domain-containing histidine kinase [Haliscomenobacter sp.]
MDIYLKKSHWKLYLAVAGILIVLISLVYTTYLTNRLAVEERTKAQLWATAVEELLKPFSEECESCKDLTIPLAIIQSNNTIPVLLVGENGQITYSRNFGTEDPKTLEKALQKMKEQGVKPLEGSGNYLYYKESQVLTQLRYFPVVQLILIAAFIFFGYLGFSTARRSEQNRVWVGMAKETAHQLGTPISAIVAWIEHLRSVREEDEEVQEVITELGNDVKRLELIADRFSKIGAMPKLEAVNIYSELDLCRAYMEKRAPRKIRFAFPDTASKPVMVRLNPPLFAWVVENLLRNSLDAMDGQGQISAEVYQEGHFACIDLSDTGKGIPSSKFKTIFQPGYTTKKRGWGLGLSLAKRIIEEYHAGKIFVKRSEEHKGTTFTIKIPLDGGRGTVDGGR